MDNDLQKFNLACEDFVSGKYILANIKLKGLIDCINSSDKLTDIVSNCLNGFNFEQMFKSSVTDNGLMLPTDDKEIIAYCFNIIYNIDLGNISFLEFLTNYFAKDELSGGEEFKIFALTIIRPFNEAINRQYSNIHVIKDTEDYQNNVYNKLMNIAKLNLENIDDLKLKDIQKEELSLLLNALITASEKNDKKLVYALLVGLEYFVKVNKHAKSVYEQLTDCF